MHSSSTASSGSSFSLGRQPSAVGVGMAATDAQLFAQYTRTLRHTQQRQQQAAAARGVASPDGSRGGGSGSVTSTPTKQQHRRDPSASPTSLLSAGSASPSTPSSRRSSVTPGASPNGHVVPAGSAHSTISASASALAAAAAAGTRSPIIPRPPRIGPEEVNLRWRAIFGEMERWCADETRSPPPATAAAASGPGAAKGTVTSAAAAAAAVNAATLARVPCGYATALAAQRAYESALDAHARVLEGHAIQVSQWHRLASAAQAQAAAGGPRPGERRLMVPPPVGPPPPPPNPPHASPYAPALQTAEDKAWREWLAQNPEQLRGDALDHRSLENRLVAYLARDGYPLTRVTQAFVTNFLDAYSAARNAALRGCTSSQASDLLLSDALPTLLHFLDALTEILARVWPELDAQRNKDTRESLRQAAMEAVFPFIFPTLFALYKRKYFYRDAELSAKMAILSSTGPGGCNLRLSDMGVSKWFCLDEAVVERERAAAKAKRRAKDRERYAREGETEEQARRREDKEDRREREREAACAAEYDAMQIRQQLLQQEQQLLQQRAAESGGSDMATSSVAAALAAAAPGASSAAHSPPRPGSMVPQPIQLSLFRPAVAAAAAVPTNSAVASSDELASHPISELTNGISASSISVTIDSGAAAVAVPIPSSSSASSAVSHASTPPSSGLPPPHTSVTISPFKGPSSGARAIPTTRLEALGSGENGTAVTAKSLSSSPRAERIQDMFLSMSPARRTAALPAPLAGPSGGVIATGSPATRGNGLLHPPDSAIGSLRVKSSLSSTGSGASTGAVVPVQQHVLVDCAVLPAQVASVDGSGTAQADVLRDSPATQSADATDASKRTQVGFAAGIDGVAVAAVPEPLAPIQPVAVAAAPAHGSSSSSLGLALQQRRAAGLSGLSQPSLQSASAAAASAAASASAGTAATAAPSSPPKSVRGGKLGLGLGNPANANGEEDGLSIPYRGDSSSDDDDGNDHRNGGSPDSGGRMPSMSGFPKLGSSLPMLQGLPSSMLTHTPGIGSELLRQERQKKQRGGGASMGGENGLSASTAAAPTAAAAPNGQPLIAMPRALAAHVSPSLAALSSLAAASAPTSPVRSKSPNVTVLPGLHAAQNNSSSTSNKFSSSRDLNGDEPEEEESYPYQEAVVLLRRLCMERTPRDKLGCLIAVSQELCWCVDKFYASAPFARKGWRPRAEELCINADDLLSIVSFILLKSYTPAAAAGGSSSGSGSGGGQTCWVAEAAFIDDFISRGMKLHMPGYFLATLQAAIELILKLDREKFVSREMEEQERAEGADSRANSGSSSGGGGGHGSAAMAVGTGSSSRTQKGASSTASVATTVQATSVSPASSAASSASSSSSSSLSARRGPMGQLILPSAAGLAAAASHSRSGSTSGSNGVVAVSQATAPSSRASRGHHQQQSSSSAASGRPSLGLGSASSAAPGSHADDADDDEEDRAVPGSWAGPFQLNLEHFSQPTTPTTLSASSSMSFGLGGGGGSHSGSGFGSVGEGVLHFASPLVPPPGALARASVEQPLDPAKAVKAAALLAQHRAAVAQAERALADRRLRERRARGEMPNSPRLPSALSPRMQAGSLAGSSVLRGTLGQDRGM